jgi:threonylcarbamoyladenosine tRNA methylthiotransferase MtaB
MPPAEFITFGCRANQYQTEQLKNHFAEEENICVINTCAVTEDAERKSRQAIRRVLRDHPKAKVIVTGCWARLEGEIIKQLFPSVSVTPPLLSPWERRIQEVRAKVMIRSNLMIQDGCENFCSYCIVPYARGKITSKPIADVIAEAEQLVTAGAREIVLTGINLGTYQYDLKKVCGLLSLIPACRQARSGLSRIRLSSVEPMYLTKELIDAIASTPKVCRHLHIPLQSGDNSILKSMHRNYSCEDYLELVKYIRRKIPDCGITTDIIAGFPGEGDKEFKNTLKLVKQANFSRLHVFPYSKRSGTPAASFPNQVDAKTKKSRVDYLREIGRQQMVAFARQSLNKEVEILVEQKGEGLTSNFIRCFFHDPSDSSGSLHKIFARLVTHSGEIRE